MKRRFLFNHEGGNNGGGTPAAENDAEQQQNVSDAGAKAETDPEDENADTKDHETMEDAGGKENDDDLGVEETDREELDLNEDTATDTPAEESNDAPAGPGSERTD